MVNSRAMSEFRKKIQELRKKGNINPNTVTRELHSAADELTRTIKLTQNQLDVIKRRREGFSSGKVPTRFIEAEEDVTKKLKAQQEVLKLLEEQKKLVNILHPKEIELLIKITEVNLLSEEVKKLEEEFNQKRDRNTGVKFARKQQELRELEEKLFKKQVNTLFGLLRDNGYSKKKIEEILREYKGKYFEARKAICEEEFGDAWHNLSNF